MRHAAIRHLRIEEAQRLEARMIGQISEAKVGNSFWCVENLERRNFSDCAQSIILGGRAPKRKIVKRWRVAQRGEAATSDGVAPNAQFLKRWQFGKSYKTRIRKLIFCEIKRSELRKGFDY